METIKSLREGDAAEVKHLRQLWQQLFQRKEHLLDIAAATAISPYALAEVDIKLAELTGQLKSIDAKIHFILFGGDILPEEAPETFTAKMESGYSNKLTKLKRKHRKEIEQCRKVIGELKSQVDAFKRTMGWQNWKVKKKKVKA